MSASLIIVDDHLLFAEALGPALEATGLSVVGIAPNADLAVRLVEEHHPDIALLDLMMEGVDGFELAERIREVSPSVRSVIVSARDDADSVAEALRRGLHGYLTKALPISSIVAGIHAVLDGEVVLPPRLMHISRAPLDNNGVDIQFLARQLTPRERDVLRLLVEGLGSEEIGERLGITNNTVRTHVQGILNKLQVHSRLEAATVAVHHHLVEPDPVPSFSRPA